MKQRLTISNILIESFSVIFAVLLALFVNEWRKDISDDRNASDALGKIIIEIKENKTKLESSITQHEETVKKLALQS